MHPLLQYIKRRIDSNQNFLCLVSGGPGTGKSYDTASLCFQIHKVFDLDVHPAVFYDLDQFIVFLKSKKVKPGMCVIIDESGLTASSRSAMTKQNKIMSMITQSFRYMRLCVFFLAPNKSFIDLAIRKLIHCHLQTITIDRSRQLGIMRVRLISVDEKTGKITYNALNIRDKKTKDSTHLDLIALPKPAEQFLIKYEEFKDKNVKDKLGEFQNKLKGRGKTDKQLESTKNNPFSGKKLDIKI